MAILREKDLAYKTPEDICTHLGEDYEAQFGAVNPPIYMTSLYVKTGDESSYGYTRVANPTTEVAERKIAALEGAEGCLCFASGMSAITSAIMHFIKSNGHVIIVGSSYGTSVDFCENYLQEKAGLSATRVRGSSFEEIKNAVRDNTCLIYLESPSSGIFIMQDLEKVAAMAKERGIGTVVDNSYASPLLQHPLQWGIDIVVHTASKYLGGHSAIVAGALCAKKEIIEEIQNKERLIYGAILGPMESYLLVMGLRTLPERLKKHGENARAVAKFLEGHPRVTQVFYPGSATYTQNDLFQKYMTGTTGLLSFQIKGTDDEVDRFYDHLEVFKKGVSWGGFESLCVPITGKHPSENIEKRNMVPNLYRLYCGLESLDSMLNALDVAFKAMDA